MTRHAGSGRFNRARWGLSQMILGAVLALVTASCGGGTFINVALVRDVSEDKPAYVGVYYLSEESAIDAEPIPDLIDSPESFTDGVVSSEVFPVYPGENKVIPLPNYDPSITWIAVVADFAEAGPCTRIKQPVEPGSKVQWTILVEDECLKLQ